MPTQRKLPRASSCHGPLLDQAQGEAIAKKLNSYRSCPNDTFSEWVRTSTATCNFNSTTCLPPLTPRSQVPESAATIRTNPVNSTADSFVYVPASSPNCCRTLFGPSSSCSRQRLAPLALPPLSRPRTPHLQEAYPYTCDPHDSNSDFDFDAISVNFSSDLEATSESISPNVLSSPIIQSLSTSGWVKWLAIVFVCLGLSIATDVFYLLLLQLGVTFLVIVCGFIHSVFARTASICISHGNDKFPPLHTSNTQCSKQSFCSQERACKYASINSNNNSIGGKERHRLSIYSGISDHSTPLDSLLLQPNEAAQLQRCTTCEHWC